MSTRSLQLFLIPGLMVDEQIFFEQKKVFPDVIVPMWQKPLRSDDLTSYAKRFAETLPLGPVGLVGYGFGGMVAMEMMPYLQDRLKGCVVISTSRSDQAMGQRGKTRAKVFSQLPEGVLAMMVRNKIRSMLISERLESEQRKILRNMNRYFDGKFVKWGFGAVSRWEYSGPNLKGAGTSFLQVHGAKDHVLKLQKGDAEVVVPDAGHLLTFTHADRVNQIIRQTFPGF